MSISRRSFLKMAGLTTVAVAGVSLFAGCSVASYLQFQLDDAARKEILGDNPTEDQITSLDTAIALLNTSMFFCPMVGVKDLDKNQVLSEIDKGLTEYEKKAPDKADTIKQIRSWMDKLDVVTNSSGKVVAEGFGYSKLLVKITVKSKAAAQAIRESLEAVV